MKYTIAVLVMILASACTSRAQTVLISDTFTFDSTGAIITYDGNPPCANPPVEVPGCFPYDMGGVVVSDWSGIDVSFQLSARSIGGGTQGYLNNGFLEPCNPVTWQAKVWTIGDGTHEGDAYNITGGAACPYFTGEYGDYLDSNNRADSYSVTANYIVHKHVSCRYRCTTYFTNALQGGSGTITETTVN